MCAKRGTARHGDKNTGSLTKPPDSSQALSMTRLFIVLLALASLAFGCSAPATAPAPKPHQQWHLTVVAPPALMEQAWQAAMDWNSALGREVFVLSGGRGTVTFREGSDAEMEGAGGWTLSDDGRHFDVLIRRDTFGCPTAFLHELGHVLGLDDVEDESDVMNWHLTGADVELSDANVSAVYAFWGWDEQARDF